MYEHTPGPWAVQFEVCASHGGEDHRHDILDGKNQMLGRVTRCGQTDYAESRANARLIAAAPDMLEALETIAAITAEMIDSNIGGDVLSIEAEARAAIAKAKGGNA